MYIYIYIYTEDVKVRDLGDGAALDVFLAQVERPLKDREINTYVYIYIYIYTCTYVYIYIYI